MGRNVIVYYVLILRIYLEIANSGIHCESPLLKCEQPYDVGNGDYDYLQYTEYHACTRECVPGDHRTCYYRFVVEAYSSMNGACGSCPNVTSDCWAKDCVTADGYERSVLVINRMMPAPSIQVCEGDRVIVDVKNIMPGRSLTIHWHGLRQINSKFMDGVPMVTQCPIMESQIFRYIFTCDQPGTFFYHSHSGLQKVDGVVGSLIVRQPKSKNPNRDYFDLDLPSHYMLVQDWRHETADSIFPGTPRRGLGQQASTYLINGRGNYINASMPWTIFNVIPGKRHVFRIVAGTCFTCQYVVTFEKHEFIIIGMDGQPTKPYKVKSCTMSPGERMTVVVNCNQKVGSYWIQVRAVGFCEGTGAYQLAILRYYGHNGVPSTPKPGFQNVTDVNDIVPTVNPFNSDCSEKSLKERGPCITDLSFKCKTPDNLRGKYYKRLIWAFGFHVFNNNTPSTNTSKYLYPKYISPGPGVSVGSTVNGKVYYSPPSPLLSQWRDIPEHIYCPEDDTYDVDRWNTEVQECVNVFSVPAYVLIEILIVDAQPFGMSHPIHLHGYDMCIVEQGVLSKFSNSTNFKDKLAALLRYLDSGYRKKVPEDCVYKDTVPLTSNGWAVARIYTDNPGFWFFHCHFAYHLDSAMAGVLRVGRKEDFPLPSSLFPKCGDFMPMEYCEQYKGY